MANVQVENGYTMIANELLEALIKYRFPPKSSLPFRLCIFVIRKTYGYHKKMDVISLSQFQKATNEKNRTNLIYWVRYLVQAKILVRIKKSDTQIEYGFNKDYEQWLTPVQAHALVQARSYGSASKDTKSSASKVTHKRKKDNTKEIVVNDTPYSLKEEIQKLEDSPRRDLNIVALYLEHRKPDLQTRVQFETSLKRHLKPAGELKHFTDSQILKALDYAKKEYKDIYTLETLIKILTK
jgi:phage replication O-like protein O